MDYVNVCGCVAHWETERWGGRKKEAPALCFPLRLSPRSLSLRTWAPFVSFTLVSILCWELFILLSVFLFFLFSAGKCWCWANPGGARAMKGKEDSIYIWILPPSGHKLVSAPLSCELCQTPPVTSALALSGKSQVRFLVPSKLDLWHHDPPHPHPHPPIPTTPTLSATWPTTAAASSACGRPPTGPKHHSARPL